MMRVAEQHRAWRALPLGSLDTVTGAGAALILAPHADDESLGCGGLIAACCQAARPPVVAVLTDGGMSHPGSKAFPREKLIPLREAEAREATSILGLPPDRLIFLREPDSEAPHEGKAFDRVAERLIRVADCFDCLTVFAPWRFDPHCDHEAAFLLAAEVASKLQLRHIAYPVWGWTLPPDHLVDAGPPVGWRLDIGCQLGHKLKAIAAYRSQHGELITDDPSGFRLPPELLRVLTGRFETFLLP
jgi:LmbE family N-acetylglucosaminyl deacetylase